MLQLPPLYPITDAKGAMPLAEQIHRLGKAGYPLVQFRGKPLDPAKQWEQLREALEASERNGGWPMICVNDRADLAVLAAREKLPPWGLHLGQGDLPPTETRRLPGLSKVHLGTSTHEDVEWGKVDGACDHAGLGPFRATSTKGDHAEPIGLEGLRRGCAALRAQGVAPVAIGGLTLLDAELCFQAGAESLAMVGEIARAEDPGDLLWTAQRTRWRARPLLQAGLGVVLIGGSGVGKSTLANGLSTRLGLPAADLDEEIERQTKASISRIFEKDGEDAFRRLEETVLPGLLKTAKVVALGGGAWQSTAIRQMVSDYGYQVLWIAENPAKAWARVAEDSLRPLAVNRDSFMARWRSRMACWAEAPMVLPLGRSPEELAECLLQSLNFG